MALGNLIINAGPALGLHSLHVGSSLEELHGACQAPKLDSFHMSRLSRGIQEKLAAGRQAYDDTTRTRL